MSEPAKIPQIDSKLTPSLPSAIAKSNLCIITPMKPSVKHKGRKSDLDVVKENMQIASIQEPSIVSGNYNVPEGCRWHNNSCAYDSLIFVLYNIWRSDPTYFTEQYKLLNNEWLTLITQSFHSYMQQQYSLVGLCAITILYSDTTSVYSIRTNAVSTLDDTIHYGH